MSNGVLSPAQLAYAYLYNPNLAQHEDHRHQQILYAYRGRTQAKVRRKDQQNEDLRRVGLAQGMVQFASSVCPQSTLLIPSDFSNGAAVDSIQTEKTRLVLKELERDWWLLVSIDHTVVRNSVASVQYLARDLSSPELLIQQLLRAHRIFLLYHGRTLYQIIEQGSRASLETSLAQYWTSFFDTWNIRLHGNPARDVFDAIRLAHGHLNMSQPLRHLTQSTDGLVDLLVSRFDTTAPIFRPNDSNPSYELAASDGLLYSGRGNLSKTAIRDLSTWMELVAVQGQAASGIHSTSSPINAIPPLVTKPSSRPQDSSPPPQGYATAEIMKYLTLGMYGSSWGVSSPKHPQAESRDRQGEFLIGLREDGISARCMHVSESCELRVVLYAQRPFIFAFFFDRITHGLDSPEIYSSLRQKVDSVYADLNADLKAASRDARGLVYDPIEMTVRTNIPNIPDPTFETGSNGGEYWSRAEAIMMHSLILHSYAALRRQPAQLEQTAKTSRGWQLSWFRVPRANQDLLEHTEAFVVLRPLGPTASLFGSIGRRSKNLASAPEAGFDVRQYLREAHL